MKKLHKIARCAGCGVRLPPDEMLDPNAELCAFCENIRGEALQIQEHKRDGGKLKLILTINAAPVGKA